MQGLFSAKVQKDYTNQSVNVERGEARVNKSFVLFPYGPVAQLVRAPA